ncbi:hypothetical protein YZOS03_35250 [Vibrio alginolyticus]|nr:hypothetical protein YZOS03_35250 [Vibrio alginolyticus]
MVTTKPINSSNIGISECYVKKKETVSVYDKEFTEFLAVARDKYGACMI